MSNTQPYESNVKKIHILIVDDDAMIRRLFGGRLTTLGYEIMYASDGNEGRETARRFHPDLVLMDENMPVMTGMEAISRMKEEPETKNKRQASACVCCLGSIIRLDPALRFRYRVS